MIGRRSPLGGIEMEVTLNVLGILAKAAIEGIPLPFTVGVVEGETRIGRGWPIYFSRNWRGDLEAVNGGSLPIVFLVNGLEYQITPGGSCTIEPVGFAGDAP
jgi:hypothetical protein